MAVAVRPAPVAVVSVPVVRRRYGWALGVAALTLFALALRVVRLDEPALRWDEGWSIGQAALPWSQLIAVGAEDWHPPLYVALLKPWVLASGKSVYAVRYLSVLLGVLGVPLVAAVGKAWSKRETVGLWAALFAATWPLLVYYGQVARMYPLTVVGVLLAGYALLKIVEAPRPIHLLALALGTAVAMYSLYYAVWPLAALYAWAALVRPRAIPRLLLAGGAAVALYVPWFPAALGALTTRAGTEPTTLADVRGMVSPTLDGVAFTYGTTRGAALVLAAALVLGLLAPGPRINWRALALPALVVGLSVAGLAYGAARSHWFAVRHFAPVAPFLGLGLAWAMARLYAWRPLAAGSILAALAIAYWPTATGFVYAKTLEVVDPFDPTADHRYLAQNGRPGDLAFFNVLHKAGWYEELRGPSDPAWSYAMRWDPIVEPMERLAPRLETAIGERERLWFVLYKGAFGTNAPLVDWLDSSPELFPAGGTWVEDTWFRLFVAPKAPMAQSPAAGTKLGPFELVSARYSGTGNVGEPLGVELTWRVDAPAPDRKVFVHLIDSSGKLVAQHDGLPASDRRPESTWKPGELVVDRHGLSPPPDASGPVRIRVGLYDPASGERVKTPSGDDGVDLGWITLGASDAPCEVCEQKWEDRGRPRSDG